MKTEFDNTIDVPEESQADHRPVEIPSFGLEKTDAAKGDVPVSRAKRIKRFNIVWLVVICCTLLAAIALIGYFRMRGGAAYRDFEVSVTDDENIAKLKLPAEESVQGSDCKSDSILGVAMEFYPLNGLKASLEWEVPDTLDQSLVLFMRSADYYPDGRTIGSIVVNGKGGEGRERRSRPAYAAISPEGKMIVGVSTTDKLYDYSVETGGSYFRQFLLLSDGEMPRDFYLHGKISRAAIGRMADDSLFYVVTAHDETMYDFADALREYGFVDAIYITGGNNYRFSRDTNGTAHLDDATKAKIEKYTEADAVAPFLVFRNGNGK